MRFLAKDTFKEGPTEEVQALMPAEEARMKELREQGLIEAMYVAADLLSAWTVWNCESQDALEEGHKSLPLHPHLNTNITLLSDDF